uniref:Uncharacterized protein n=1 Tax=Panagrellus redivivus TaxID=6233 RepID=A0A7E4W9Y2_PANRE
MTQTPTKQPPGNTTSSMMVNKKNYRPRIHDHHPRTETKRVTNAVSQASKITILGGRVRMHKPDVSDGTEVNRALCQGNHRCGGRPAIVLAQDPSQPAPQGKDLRVSDQAPSSVVVSTNERGNIEVSAPRPPREETSEPVDGKMLLNALLMDNGFCRKLFEGLSVGSNLARRRLMMKA